MSEKKTIAVMGATGAQGGGLVRAILADKRGEFSVRALTRNTNSEKAKELAAQGAELVETNVDSLESVRAAFAGAYGAYCVTFFWDHFSPEKEIAHAQNMAQAAKDEGLAHVIWSTLEDTRKWVPLEDDRMPTLMERYKVPHFDAKGESDRFFADAGVPTTFLLTCFYWDNFIYFGSGPKPGPDGKLALTFPIGDKKLPGIAADDIGKCALGIFKAGDKYKNQTVGIAGEHLSGNDMAAGLSRALGQEVGYNAVPADVYRSFGFPGAEDLGNMFQFNAEFADYFCGVRDPEVARSLNPSLQTFDDWLAQHKDQIPLD